MEREESQRTLDSLYGSAVSAIEGGDEALLHSAFFQAVSRLSQRHGKRARAEVLRNILRKVTSENRRKIDTLSYTAAVKELIHNEFKGIAERLESFDDDYFDLNNLEARNELRIAALSRIPAGVEHFELSAIPRGILYRGGAKQGFRFLRMLANTGGVKPFYETHLADRLSSSPLGFFRAYNPEARQQAYWHIAQCLELNPQVRGFLTGSWWFDPRIKDISPALGHLGDMMLDNGAQLYCYGPDSSAKRNALANSPRRQELYRAGEYLPQTFIIVWPRKEMIAWANQ